MHDNTSWTGRCQSRELSIKVLSTLSRSRRDPRKEAGASDDSVSSRFNFKKMSAVVCGGSTLMYTSTDIERQWIAQGPRSAYDRIWRAFRGVD